MSDHAMPWGEPFWTVRDVQQLLRLGRNTVYELAERGVLPSFRVGSRVRFDPAKVRAWIEAQHKPDAAVVPFAGRGR